MSKHYITTTYDPDGAEIEARIHFVLHPFVPERGPSYASGGDPAEAASVEFVNIQTLVSGKWTDAPDLVEWAEDYLQNDGLPDAFEVAHDDCITAEEYAAEARAETRREIGDRGHADLEARGYRMRPDGSYFKSGS